MKSPEVVCDVELPELVVATITYTPGLVPKVMLTVACVALTVTGVTVPPPTD